MHKARTPKRKSHQRFEQLNHIVDNVICKLPTGHTAALFVCFRHAREGGRFHLSTSRLASTLGVNKRTAQRLLHDLEAWGVIRTVKREQGTIPKSYKITGDVTRDDNQATLNTKSATRSSDDRIDG